MAGDSKFAKQHYRPSNTGQDILAHSFIKGQRANLTRLHETKAGLPTTGTACLSLSGRALHASPFQVVAAASRGKKNEKGEEKGRKTEENVRCGTHSNDASRRPIHRMYRESNSRVGGFVRKSLYAFSTRCDSTPKESGSRPTTDVNQNLQHNNLLITSMK